MGRRVGVCRPNSINPVGLATGCPHAAAISFAGGAPVTLATAVPLPAVADPGAHGARLARLLELLKQHPLVVLGEDLDEVPSDVRPLLEDAFGDGAAGVLAVALDGAADPIEVLLLPQRLQ